MLLDRNATKLEESAAKLASPRKVKVLTGDLMDVHSAGRAVAATVAGFGKLDVLVNAAGNTERCGLDNTTPQSYERLFGVNVRAPLFMMQEAVKAMRANGSGTVINCSSMLAHDRPIFPPIRRPRRRSTR